MKQQLSKTMLLNEIEFAMKNYKRICLELHIRGEARSAEYFSDESGNPIKNLLKRMDLINKKYKENLESKKPNHSEIVKYEVKGWT